MHLPSFNDLVFVLSLGTVIVSASPIVGRREAQLLGYMHPRESDGPKFQELKRIVSSTSSPVTSTISENPPQYFTPNRWEVSFHFLLSPNHLRLDIHFTVFWWIKGLQLWSVTVLVMLIKRWTDQMLTGML
ncbi:hypothetical protein LENED_003120 [Lentinula edodes]|uniref:Uncharacterized protein n=1 Tax=Lentinula edodes TaxID=5353 RepID=A0A1Q3E3C0_LENED|nr:hypothetical protein LENED_003120 [Lentinula edodes]